MYEITWEKKWSVGIASRIYKIFMAIACLFLCFWLLFRKTVFIVLMADWVSNHKMILCYLFWKSVFCLEWLFILNKLRTNHLKQPRVQVHTPPSYLVQQNSWHFLCWIMAFCNIVCLLIQLDILLCNFAMTLVTHFIRTTNSLQILCVHIVEMSFNKS